ncbi:MAG: peptidoglycan-binding protein, partial [Alphaproteobacteria bacterium]
MRRTNFALAGVIIAMSSGISAQAGLLPPTVWESTALPSVEILAMRETLQAAVRAASKASSGLTKNEIAALETFYEARQYQPVWFSATGAKPGAQAIVDLFANADTHALNAADYAFAGDALAGLPSLARRLEQAGAEAALSTAALLYARHASAGRINPAVLGKNVTQKPVAADPALVLATLGQSKNPARYLEGLQPSSVEYKVLRAAYLDLRSKTIVEWAPIPAGRSLKPGARDGRVAALRQRLMATGDYGAADPLAVQGDEIYTPALVEAVKAFQLRSGLRSEGIVGRLTLAALNFSPDYRREQLAVNLERRRWLPHVKDRGSRYVLVN